MMTTNIKSLQQTLIEWTGKKTIENSQIPQFVTDNLNSKFLIRPYQEKAFKYFQTYWNESFDGKPRKNHQLLFHMATGAGKTLIMAGLMLDLYSKGYRNFLFFVNSTNIINKTKDNFLNQASSKFLFANQVSIGEKKVRIREVSNFQSSTPDDINIIFSTIQGLHFSLDEPKENGITIEDFEDKKIVLISDEAHHINAETKKGSELSKEEFFEATSWEGTIQKIFTANPDNVLLEFTATVDFNDEFLAKKYLPKLIFDYPLKDFRRDGYSKEVKVLQADMVLFDRALQAIILSQYRRKVFEKYGKLIKPVVLFKSKTVVESKNFLIEFCEKLSDLEESSLYAIEQVTSDPALIRAFQYFRKNGISFENLIAELQDDFSKEKLISVNSKEESEEKQLAVNSLEENEFRAVFAVDKLNEGWDVLNLFDIVRLNEGRDARANKVGKTTMSEAQLIGRGARYCPFQINSDQPMYGRKYDYDLDNELRICEELYYHSSHNPKYIQELNVALREIGIKAKDSRELQVKLKDSFINTPLFKVGHIFLNDRVKYLREDITSLDSSLVPNPFKFDLLTGYTTTSAAFEVGAEKGASKVSKDFPLLSFGDAIVRKAIQKLEFYEFSNLKKYLPNLKSISEFIGSKNYLGKIVIEFTGLENQVKNLDSESKLYATIALLEEISLVIQSDKVEFKGSKEFKPKMIKDIFTNKTLNIVVEEDSDQEFGKSMSDDRQTAYHLDLSTRAWFAFDDCFGTSEEKLLIKYIDKKYEELSNFYSEVYLLRNERHFKIYSFDDGRALEPDFLLYLVGKEAKDTMHYQVFIEPKGSHLLLSDRWKEDFLTSIKANQKIEQLFANKQYVVWGMPFFNQAERITEFDSAFNQLLGQ
jgi:type III restriction enzyme